MKIFKSAVLVLLFVCCSICNGSKKEPLSNYSNEDTNTKVSYNLFLKPIDNKQNVFLEFKFENKSGYDLAYSMEKSPILLGLSVFSLPERKMLQLTELGERFLGQKAKTRGITSFLTVQIEPNKSYLKEFNLSKIFDFSDWLISREPLLLEHEFIYSIPINDSVLSLSNQFQIEKSGIKQTIEEAKEPAKALEIIVKKETPKSRPKTPSPVVEESVLKKKEPESIAEEPEPISNNLLLYIFGVIAVITVLFLVIRKK